jgi:hypothetical protein
MENEKEYEINIQILNQNQKEITNFLDEDNNNTNSDKEKEKKKTINKNTELNLNKNHIRPQTPHIDLFNIRSIKSHEPDQIIKNFASFVKQIIDRENEKFLNGEINLIEFIISKYTNVDIKNISELEKLSIKIHAEFGLLNQFGQKLPKLKELRLNGSNIISIPNIGTEFRNLLILQVNKCNIKDLSGKKIILFYIILFCLI